MIREHQDEFVCWDLILLNATSPVNSCLFCHCRFQAVSWVCVVVVGVGGQKAWSFESCTLLNYPSLVPLWEVDLSSLLVGQKNMTHGPARSQVALLAIIEFMFIMLFVKYSKCIAEKNLGTRMFNCLKKSCCVIFVFFVKRLDEYPSSVGIP